MTRKLFLSVFLVLVLSFVFLPQKAFSQTAVDTTQLKAMIEKLSDLEFNLALLKYVKTLFLNYGEENLPREKFLVTLMRLVNNEMRQRIVDPKAARMKYFNDLKEQLKELEALKQRLKSAGITELDAFVKDLEVRMRYTIQSGEIDYKKKKVFEDALQLLYVAEEMIKLDQIKEPEKLTTKISKSKDKLLHAFGEVGQLENVPLEVQPTIFNLFEEWKKTQTTQFDARLLDVKIARINLIKSGSMQDVLRMFKNELRMALGAFNYYDYDLADRLFADLVETYQPVGLKNLDDVYYYWAESNFALSRFDRAQSIYSRLLQEYPGSSFTPRVYSRLIQIAHKLNDYPAVFKYYQHYRNIVSENDPDLPEIQFLVGLTYFHQNRFNEAVDIFLSFPEKSPYYFLAQYLVGSIYAAGKNYDMAQNLFNTLIARRDVPPDIYSRALYKLALIHFQKQEYTQAAETLALIPEDFARYDKVLNAMAWTMFKIAENNALLFNEPDYSRAKYYAQRLVDNYYASEYRMEAQSLLAYIYQIENKPLLARSMYEEVYDAKRKEKSVASFLSERDSIEALYSQAVNLADKALQENNRDAYIKASDLADKLEQQLYEMDLAEMASVGSALTREVNDILDQLEEFKQIKAVAEAKGNKAAVQKADSAIVRLTAVLDMFPEKYLLQATYFNWFDAYPITRKEAEYQFRTRKLEQQRQTIRQELGRLDSQIAALQKEVEREKVAANYRRINELEREIDKLTELRKKYDALYTATFDLSPGEHYAEFDKWGDFGAFGIIDVQFGQRNRLQKRLTEVSQLYNATKELLDQRRKVVEDKLKKIEAEIRFMTMKARIEERIRLRAERERAFRETFFDKRTSEFEE